MANRNPEQVETRPDEAAGADAPTLRVAIVHYWYVKRRGGERVVEALAEMFPQSDLFFLFADSASFPDSIRSHQVTTSFMQKIPGVKRHYRKMLPLMPLAVERFRLDGYDLVLSSESGPAKGVRTRPETCHICYCHTPPRYLWNMYDHYRSTMPLGALGRSCFSLAARYLRAWDYASSARVDYFVANSRNVAGRIREYYRREAEVIYPPVDVASFTPGGKREDFYLVVSPLVSYKRIDLAIAACAALGRPLVVIGDGEELPALRRRAGANVKFLGFQPDDAVKDHYRRCRALLFPGEEDFGMTPVEAQASGCSVIAYGRGGALETVRGDWPGSSFKPESSTGIFFAEQSANSLADAMRFFESVEARFSPEFIRTNALRFDTSRFKTEIGALIAAKMLEHRARHSPPQAKRLSSAADSEYH
jgi:glycosyltransferase involved in cell wall biosynthesis